MPTVLLVEDTFALRLSVAANLRAAGFEVTPVASAEEAALAHAAASFELVVLDWMLPGKSGMELLQDWRAQGVRTPVILLTARDAIADRVQGLGAGADDYLVKPFATEELVARIQVQLRRRAPAARGTPLSDRSLDLSREVVVGPDGEQRLTTREAELLRYLVARAGHTVSREELQREVWGYAESLVTRAVDNTVRRLRPKLEQDPARPKHLLTVHGTGYRLEL